MTGLYISAHATDGSAGNVVDRIDQSPQQDFSGNCSGSYDISVSVLGVGAGGSFADCDHFDIAFSATEPAYYRNYMEQGAVFSGGNRAVGASAEPASTAEPASNADPASTAGRTAQSAQPALNQRSGCVFTAPDDPVTPVAFARS